MSASSASRVLRHAARSVSRSAARHQYTAPLRLVRASTVTSSTTRCLTTSIRRPAGLMPDTHEPKAPDTEVADGHATTHPAEVSEEEYHEHADRYMNELHDRAEEMQEEKSDVEVDYAAGVLSITFPPNGTYIVNKQPANKQIWLSSPLSGPKRYDWVVSGESMHQKADGGSGDWVYIRDGTSLTELLRKEVGISLDLDPNAEAIVKPSTDPVE